MKMKITKNELFRSTRYPNKRVDQRRVSLIDTDGRRYEGVLPFTYKITPTPEEFLNGGFLDGFYK